MLRKIEGRRRKGKHRITSGMEELELEFEIGWVSSPHSLY